MRRVLAILGAYLFITSLVLLSSGRLPHHDLKASAVPDSQQTALGKRVWEREACMVCHSIFGLGGHLGPDLTNTVRLRGDTYLRHVIRNGVARMPSNDRLTDEEVAALIAYLHYVDALGDYPLQSPWTQFFGNPSRSS